MSSGAELTKIRADLGDVLNYFYLSSDLHHQSRAFQLLKFSINLKILIYKNFQIPVLEHKPPIGGSMKEYICYNRIQMLEYQLLIIIRFYGNSW